MADKVLTISIAAYNLSERIDQCLASFASSKFIDDIELIVTNDGSKDDTAKKVEKWVERYPNSIRLINKKNEGAGSTVNSGILHAAGKYFKMVDGDDWVENIDEFVALSTGLTTEVPTEINRKSKYISATTYSKPDSMSVPSNSIDAIENMKYKKKFVQDLYKKYRPIMTRDISDIFKQIIDDCENSVKRLTRQKKENDDLLNRYVQSYKRICELIYINDHFEQILHTEKYDEALKWLEKIEPAVEVIRREIKT